MVGDCLLLCEYRVSQKFLLFSSILDLIVQTSNQISLVHDGGNVILLHFRSRRFLFAHLHCIFGDGVFSVFYYKNFWDTLYVEYCLHVCFFSEKYQNVLLCL